MGRECHNEAVAKAWARLYQQRWQENQVHIKKAARRMTQVRRRNYRRPRIGMGRYTVLETVQIFGCSERETSRRIENHEVDGVGTDGVRTIFLPEPVPDELRPEYERLWDAMLAILVEHDSVGIVGWGAPGEQYCTELETIMPRLQMAAHTEDVARLVHEEYSFWFGSSIADRASYTELSAKIWEMWRGSPRRTFAQ